MRVAEIHVTYGSYSSAAVTSVVGFEDTSTATTEFERLKLYLDRREKRANDLEKIVIIAGINSFTCPGEQITGIGLFDFAKANDSEAGVRDAFPNIFKR